MSAFSRLRRREMLDDAEPNMVPIMNMFMVLIPFLLMSASFYHIKAVNTSVPVLSESIDDQENGPIVSLTLVVELKKDSLKVSAMSEQLTDDELSQFKAEYPCEEKNRYPMELFTVYLENIKALYPKSDTLILIPDSSTDYETIISTMDTARKTGETSLFARVVLSGSLG